MFQPAIQRSCGCGTKTSHGGECDACRRKRIQRRALDNVTEPGDAVERQADHMVASARRTPSDMSTMRTPRSSVPAGLPRDVQQVIGSGGRPLDASLRAEAERGFGVDFSDVRVHDGRAAAMSAQDLEAQAYAVGTHVVFNDGYYAPHTAAGRELLWHELAHVAQDTNDGTISRRRLETNESSCRATMVYRVQLIFDDTDASTWTAARKTAFRAAFRRTIQDTFNANSYAIRPAAATRESAWYESGDTSPCPCAESGFSPRVRIDLVPDGEWSTSEDWEVDVAANPTAGNFMRSGTTTSYGDLDEQDNTAVHKGTAPAGVTQVPTVHEFGHAIGLHHPGRNLDGNAANGTAEYAHTGTDEDGHAVHGPTDLMGSGMDLRPFYFQWWVDELNSRYGSDCTYTIS